jgi:hypothetical protein
MFNCIGLYHSSVCVLKFNGRQIARNIQGICKMKCNGWLIVLVFVLMTVAASTAWADYSWQYFGGHEYALTQSWGTWVDHEAEAVSLGGHLATINNADENEWIARTFNNVHAHDYNDSWGLLVDIGYYYNSTNAQWEWISGEPVTYTNCDPGAWGYPLAGPHAYIHEASHFYPGTWNMAPYCTEPDGYYLAFGVIELPVPEPSTLILLGIGGISMLAYAWRRRQTS